MTEEVLGRAEPLELSEDDRARIAKLRLGKRGRDIDPDLHERFEHTLAQLSDEHIVEFEALCFFRAYEVERPYTALKNAPNMDEEWYVAPLVKAVYEQHADLMERMRDSAMESPWLFFAEAVGRALAKPGCAPGLIEADGRDFEGSGWAHPRQQAGGAVNSYFSTLVWHGLVFDAYFFFQNAEAFGEGTALAVSLDYLTEVGVEYSRWLFPERVEELFQIEVAVRQ